MKNTRNKKVNITILLLSIVVLLLSWYQDKDNFIVRSEDKVYISNEEAKKVLTDKVYPQKRYYYEKKSVSIFKRSNIPFIYDKIDYHEDRQYYSTDK